MPLFLYFIIFIKVFISETIEPLNKQLLLGDSLKVVLKIDVSTSTTDGTDIIDNFKLHFKNNALHY